MADRSPPEPVRRTDPPGDRTAVPPPAPRLQPSDVLTGLPDQSTIAGGGVTPLPPGEVGKIPDFELLKEIGRGGMGVVYKARQKSLDRVVALKMLPAGRAKDPVLLARFLDEARTAASMSHPNIVGVHQIGECPAGHFFVMEYVRGTTLQKVLDQRGPEKPVPILWAAEVMGTLAQAVHYAHTRGVFHRDLKPANVIIERASGRPVVLDFGIARRLPRPGEPDPLAAAVGTPCYMSPEQAGEAVGTLGTPSDVYALGAILYRMLAGRLPFEAATALETLLLVAGPVMPEPARKLRPEVPMPLNLICMKCLNKRADDRYQSCEVLARELKAFLASPGAAAAVKKTVQRPAAEPPVSEPAVVLEVEESGKQFRLKKAVSLIGRGPECDLVIKKADVSKRHCRILLRPDGAEVEDLDSSTGTAVNGDLVRQHALEDGDRLEVGRYAFRVRLELKPEKE